MGASTDTQRVADALREEILRGDHQPGELIGRRDDLCQRFRVSDITIRGAVKLLTQQGLVVSQRGPGGGVVAAARTVVARLTHERYVRYPGGADSTSPSGTTDFDQVTSGEPPGVVTYTARRVIAPPNIAARLDLKPGAEVVQIDYVFHSSDRLHILQASTSWEPLSLVGDTAAEITGKGDRLYGRDVISRMDLIGARVTQAVEETQAVAATGDQAARLDIEPGAPLMLVERTHFASDGCAVETADILLPGHLHKRVDYITVHDA